MLKELLIQPYDNPLRFLIQSGSRAEVSFLVDLAEEECSCEDWQFRSQGTAGYRCKHVLAAREHLLNLVIDRLK